MRFLWRKIDSWQESMDGVLTFAMLTFKEQQRSLLLQNFSAIVHRCIRPPSKPTFNKMNFSSEAICANWWLISQGKIVCKGRKTVVCFFKHQYWWSLLCFGTWNSTKEDSTVGKLSTVGSRIQHPAWGCSRCDWSCKIFSGTPRWAQVHRLSGPSNTNSYNAPICGYDIDIGYIREEFM